VTVALALLAFVLAAWALSTGSPWLGAPVVLGIPAGNLLAWLMMVSLPLAGWVLLRRGQFRRPAGILVLMGALWLPVSMLLAGNVQLNFQGGGLSLTWLAYTGACLVGPAVLLAARLARRARARRG
jgi:hypothetical protein